MQHSSDDNQEPHPATAVGARRRCIIQRPYDFRFNIYFFGRVDSVLGRFSLFTPFRSRAWTRTGILCLRENSEVSDEKNGGDQSKPAKKSSCHTSKPHNACLQLRRAISIPAEGKHLLEKHAIAPSAARLCFMPRSKRLFGMMNRPLMLPARMLDIYSRSITIRSIQRHIRQ
jgi:hypothetical protein